MSALAWWLIPIGATVLAIAFVMLRGRPAKPQTSGDDRKLQRMAEAMERPLPVEGPEDPRPVRPGDPDA